MSNDRLTQHKKTHTIYYRIGIDNVPDLVRVLHASQDAHRHLVNTGDFEQLSYIVRHKQPVENNQHE